MEQWKEACLEVVPVGRYDKETTGKLAEQVAYEFPDGWGESFGEERFREGEVWYDPKNYFDQVSFTRHIICRPRKQACRQSFGPLSDCNIARSSPIYAYPAYIQIWSRELTITVDRTPRTPPLDPNNSPLALAQGLGVAQPAGAR